MELLWSSKHRVCFYNFPIGEHVPVWVGTHMEQPGWMWAFGRSKVSGGIGLSIHTFRLMIKVETLSYIPFHRTMMSPRLKSLPYNNWDRKVKKIDLNQETIEHINNAWNSTRIIKSFNTVHVSKSLSQEFLFHLFISIETIRYPSKNLRISNRH